MPRIHVPKGTAILLLLAFAATPSRAEDKEFFCYPPAAPGGPHTSMNAAFAKSAMEGRVVVPTQIIEVMGTDCSDEKGAKGKVQEKLCMVRASCMFISPATKALIIAEHGQFTPDAVAHFKLRHQIVDITTDLYCPPLNSVPMDGVYRCPPPSMCQGDLVHGSYSPGIIDPDVAAAELNNPFGKVEGFIRTVRDGKAGKAD